MVSTWAGRLGVDFGTSNTVAVYQRADGSAAPLLFDASPMLSSAVFAGPETALLTGADATRAWTADPAGYEPNPKRRIDDGTVWLGQREVEVVDLIGVVLARVAGEAHRVLGGPPGPVTLTHPAAWSRARLGLLTEAARRADLGAVRLTPEPVAAAAYFASMTGRSLATGRCVLVYDLGAGTFDASVVRRTADGFEVLATDGIPDLGGLDLDALVVAHARSLTASHEGWGRLDWPQTPEDQRARRMLWDGARAVKEQLTRHPSATLHVPLVDRDIHLTREEFERAAGPQLDRTVDLTLATLRGAVVPREQVDGLFLVGGSSRIPLAATLLHQRLGIAPTVIDQPELVVAQGSILLADAPQPAPIYQPATAAGPAAAVDPTPDAPVRPAVEPGKAKRRRLLIGAAAFVVAAAATGIVLWQTDLLPRTVPSTIDGTHLNARGKQNAKLFSDKNLLTLAAPYLNQAICEQLEPSGQSTETISCKADTDTWMVRFETAQSDAVRNTVRQGTDQHQDDPGFKAYTWYGKDPQQENGHAALWSGEDGCRVYWDDEKSRAYAVLTLKQSQPDTDPSYTICETAFRTHTSQKLTPRNVS